MEGQMNVMLCTFPHDLIAFCSLRVWKYFGGAENYLSFFSVFWRFLALWNRCCNLPTLQSMASISAMLHSWWLGGRTLGPLNFSALVVGEGKALHLGVSQVSTLEQLIFDSESTLLEKAGTACKSGELVTTVSKHLKFTVWNEEKVRI